MAYSFQIIPANITFSKDNSFKKTNLVSNLYTKENLKGVCVARNITATKNTCSPKIASIDANLSKTNPLYYNYSIDPRGQLFGRTPCGLNNYMNYATPSLQCPTEDT